MSDLKLSMAEQETIVRWDRESDILTVFTHSETAAKKLITKGAKVKYTSAEGRAWGLEMPKEWFKWPRPKGGKGRKGNPEALRKARQNRLQAQIAKQNGTAEAKEAFGLVRGVGNE